VILPMRKAAFIHSAQLDEFSYPPDCQFNSSRAGKVRKISYVIYAVYAEKSPDDKIK